jgi:hypothetical protein
MIPTPGGTDPNEDTVVTYNRPADDPDRRFRSKLNMLRKDFLKFHRPYEPTQDNPPSEPLVVVDICDGDEWESVNGDSVRVVSVNPRKTTAVVEDSAKRRREVPFKELASGRWRKIVRRTAYERLLDDNEDL